MTISLHGSPPPRLQVRGVTQRYGRVLALDDVSLDVQPGEVLALLGQNGAGKSTLVRILSGLEHADAGEVRIDGHAVELGSASRAQAAGIAVVQQEISAVRDMTVAENLVLGDARFSWVWQPRALRAHAADLLRRVGLAHVDPTSPMDQLSIGEMQLVEIARVLSRDARLVIFDEPTAALSDAEIARILGLVQQLAAQGRSIIYVTHRLKEVFRVAHRVTVLRGGRHQASWPTGRLDVNTVVESMVGRAVSTLYPPPGPMGGVVLDVDELRAPGLAAPVSFSVRAGEVLGLTGQIGSGHDTVVEVLAGLLPGCAGAMTVHGQPVRLASRKAGLANGVAYCSEDRKRDGMFAELPVLRNLSSPWLPSVGTAGVISRRRETAEAAAAAGAFALDPHRLGSRVGLLSGGNQQKVALAKWLGARPSVLVLHEPTRGVDVGARAEIYARLRELCAKGMVVVMASSDTDEVLGLCDTIMTFYRGGVTAVRGKGDWTEAQLLREVMHEPARAS